MAATAQLSVRAIVLSMLLAMILAAANTYLGLFAGLTIASAIPAAVISMGVLRLLGGGTILENNIVATGASAAASIAAGVIFTIPALVILQYWTDFEYSWVFTIAGLGGILGVLFSVPLRRSLIIEQQLKFPEGVAAAEVLKTGANPAQGLRILAGSALGGGLVKLLAGSGMRLIPDTAAIAGYAGKSIAYMAVNLSPALLGVGYIVGLNIGILIVGGGIISWNIAIPLYAAHYASADPALAATLQGLSAGDAAYAIWAAKIRYLGVGAMLIGGIWAVVNLRSSLLSGVRSGLAATRAGADAALAETERDLPMNLVLIGIVLFTIPLALLYQAIVGNWGVSLPMTIIMIVAGFIFCSVSAYMAGLVGSSNNPVSGITICTILFASLVLWLLMGRTAPLGPVAAIIIGAVVCCAAAVGGDNLQDLKCGLYRGRHALASGSHAGDRRGVLRARDGAGAEPAEFRLWHWRADRRAPDTTARATGDPDGVGRAGHVRRRAAVEPGGDRRRDRHCDHHRRSGPEGARRAIPHARTRGRSGHLSATRTFDADFPWRSPRPLRRSRAWREAGRRRSRARERQGCAVRRGHDHG